MGTKLTIAGSFEPVEVDLFGHEFETKQVTRSTQLALGELEELVDAAERDADADKMVEALAQVLDLQLKGTDSKRTTAGDVVRKKWQGDELNLLDLVKFVEDLGNASRPS